MTTIKFGYQQASHSFGESTNSLFESLAESAKRAENQNYDSFWVMDHLVQIQLVGEPEDPIMEAYTTLAALAPLTSKIKLGVLCTCNFFRNPSLVAKMGATLDQISKGRFWLGLGAGWFEEEAQMYGYKFPDYKTRIEMLEEALEIIEGAWRTEGDFSFSFHGKHYSVEKLVISPKPIQRPRPQILVGGEGKPILKLVAKYGDACNLLGSLKKEEELQRKLTLLEKYCKALGRPYSNILKTKLTSIMYGKDREDAKRKIEQLKPDGMSLETYLDSFLYGNPSEISDQISTLVDLGIQYLIINFRGKKYDPANQEIFAREIMTRF